jgi:hypothetical protein
LRSPPLNQSLWKSTFSHWVPCLVWETWFIVALIIYILLKQFF